MPRIAVAAALLALTACSHEDPDPPRRAFAADGIVVRVPPGWDATGFSTTVFPRRLAVASYELPPRAVEGDCGGIAAVEALPRDGGLVIVIAYAAAREAPFPPRPRHFRLDGGTFAVYECFGKGTMFRFRVDGRNFQAHVVLGDAAGRDVSDRALTVLDSLAVAPGRRRGAAAVWG